MNLAEQRILQKNLAQFLVGDVFNLITEEDLLKISAPNVWMHKGQQLSPGQVKALREQASVFKDSQLWKILEAELKYHAQKKILDKGQTEADIISAKMLIYLTDILRTRLDNMTKE